MAVKLSAAVLPVVVDTSGVDKGVAQVNNKLRKVGGRGGIGGGGAGFSAGVSPYGAGFGGSGVGEAMAVAFGAAAANRSFRIGYDPQIGRMKFEDRMNYAKSSFVGQGFMKMSDYAGRRMAYYADQNAALRAADTAAGISRKQGVSNPTRIANQRKYDFYRRMRNRFNIAATTAETAMTLPVMGLASSGAALATGLGVAAAAYGVVKGAGSRNMEDRFGDITRFQGTSNYTAARALKADYYKNATPTASQGFFMGLRQGTGGGKSVTEKLYTGLGDIPSSIGQTVGQVIGTAEVGLGLSKPKTPQEAQAAAMTSANLMLQASQGGAMGWNGIVGNGIYNFFARIFN